jgi:hypothetical protein
MTIRDRPSKTLTCAVLVSRGVMRIAINGGFVAGGPAGRRAAAVDQGSSLPSLLAEEQNSALAGFVHHKNWSSGIQTFTAHHPHRQARSPLVSLSPTLPIAVLADRKPAAAAAAAAPPCWPPPLLQCTSGAPPAGR